MRTMLQWHWTSSAVCLVGMLLFAGTGITLNHAGQIPAEPEITTAEAVLPSELLAELAEVDADGDAPLPPATAAWLSERFGKPIGVRPAEWSEDEAYLSMPGPGSDAWLAIDRVSGDVEFEATDRGWIAYFNDLHKGRHTGAAWRWFIDVFSAATFVFCLTGLYLLWFHARRRPSTWPLVGLGLIGPLLLALLFVH
ncbi:PepSY-associated TM helix domain-containing protein [Alienimonas sp. DA493]|uniref:PepSY-associated TM helix domain-containing protein n=1 Tax=Alienimonas sp. DA493 TaxID=3373605 RepID=UPI003754B288